jgi:hypothetical protein
MDKWIFVGNIFFKGLFLKVIFYNHLSVIIYFKSLSRLILLFQQHQMLYAVSKDTCRQPFILAWIVLLETRLFWQNFRLLVFSTLYSCVTRGGVLEYVTGKATVVIKIFNTLFCCNTQCFTTNINLQYKLQWAEAVRYINYNLRTCLSNSSRLYFSKQR